jgi:putative membrane protein
MFLEIILAILLGVASGIFTGLIPGVHINLVAALILSITFLSNLDPTNLITFIVAMSITHTILDSIPSIYLGAPDADQVLSVLPGHKLLLKGRGHEAIVLTIIGSLFAVIISVLLSPTVFILVSSFYTKIKAAIPFLLILTLIFLILKDKTSKFVSFIIVLLAGSLGFSTLNLENDQILFPLFSGLFGTSTLIVSLNNKTKIPKQIISFPKLKMKKLLSTLSFGFFAGLLTGTLPGLGAAQAATMVESINKIKNKYYLVLTGSLNTFVMIFSFITLYSIDRARNGSVIAISKIVESFTFSNLILALAVALTTAGIATILALKISKKFSILLSKINYKKISIIIIIFITALTFYLTSFIGLLILLTSTFLGIYVNLRGIARSHLMAVLIIPVIFYLIL